MPLTLSQELQLLCFHLTGKPIGKRKFSATTIDGISCAGFSPSLVPLGSLPQVLTKTAASFAMEYIVSHKTGSCWAPALQSFHWSQGSPTLKCLGRRALCETSQESHQKVQSFKIKLEHQGSQLGHLECFGVQDDLDLASRFDKAAAEDTGGKKNPNLYYQWGRIQSLLNISIAGGEKFRQRGEQNPQRSTTYFPYTDIYTSVAFFLILPFFLGRKAKSKCRESHFHGSHMNAVLSNSGLLLQRATLPGGSRQFRQCQLPTHVTSSGSLT